MIDETGAKDRRRRLRKLLVAQHNFAVDQSATNWARVIKAMDDYQAVVYPRPPEAT